MANGGFGKHQQLPTLLGPSLQFGAACGTIGVVVGGASGVLRSTTPVLFATVSGIQWFGLGSVFWFSRSNILRYKYADTPTPRERVYASSIAGALAGGTVGAVMRGRSNILPGIIVFSIFGYGGQYIYNRLDASRIELHDVERNKTPSLMARFADVRWSPMQNLSDQQYEAMLREKLLRVDAEIALLDDKIEELRKAK